MTQRRTPGCVLVAARLYGLAIGEAIRGAGGE
jgi:hypothetical protein